MEKYIEKILLVPEERWNLLLKNETNDKEKDNDSPFPIEEKNDIEEKQKEKEKDESDTENKTHVPNSSDTQLSPPGIPEDGINDIDVETDEDGKPLINIVKKQQQKACEKTYYKFFLENITMTKNIVKEQWETPFMPVSFTNCFPRRRAVSSGINYQSHCDVGYLEYKEDNTPYMGFLCCIDVFSRKVYARLITSVSARSIISCFIDIFKETKPKRIRTDLGCEFVSRAIKNFLKKENVLLFHTNNNLIKSNYCECAIYTLKRKISRYLVHYNTYVWKTLFFFHNQELQ